MASESHRAEERRRWQRETTDRQAQFEARQPDSRPRHGRVTDISLNGVCLETRHPLPVNTDIDIEMSPRGEAPGSAILVRGRVIRYAPARPGYTAMGVRLEVGPKASEATAAMGDAAAFLERLRAQMNQLRPDAPSPLAMAEFHRSERLRPKEHREAKRRRSRGLAALALLLLLLFALAAGYTAGSVLPPETPIAPGRVAAAFGPPRGELTPAPVALEGEGEDGGAEPKTLAAGTPERAEPATAPSLGTPENPAPAEAFAAVAAPELTPWGETLAALEDLAALTAAGAPLPETLEAAPAPWREFAREVAEQGTPAEGVAPAAWPPGVALDPDTGAAAGALTLHVDKSDHVLTVLRGTRPVAAFPVGLGENDSTPLGSFAIANKLVDPTWYNKGDPVAPGDPRNPLGASWMGLGGPAGATPYGIHPTSDCASIGSDQSAGCIRMRPSDAATLFTLCPLGTRVTIRP